MVDLGLAGGACDRALGAVNQDGLALDQGLGHLGAGSHDRGDAQRAGEDGGVGGGAALGSNEGHDLLGVEQRGVGRSQVLGNQDKVLSHLRDAGHGGVGEDRDDAVAHVSDVARALSHVAAQGLQHV